MQSFLRQQAQGAAIRISALASVVVLNFLAPRLYGAHAFGSAVYLASVAYIVQGLQEPVVQALTIRWANEAGNEGRVRRLWLDTVLLGLVGVSLSCVFVVRALGDGEWLGVRIETAAIVGGFLVAFMAATNMMALAYAEKDFRVVLSGHIAAAVVTVIVLVLLQRWGARGYLYSLFFGQLATAAVQMTSPRVRAAMGRALYTRVRATPIGVAACYLPAVAPRLAVVLLQPLSILVAGSVMPMEQVAAFKITISLIAAGRFVLPISPPVFQAALSGAGSPGRRRLAQRMLLGVFILGFFLSAILFLLGDRIHLFLVGEVPARSMRLRFMFFGLPFFVLIQPVASYLFAGGKERALSYAVSITACCWLAALLWKDLELAFLVGAVVFVAVAVALARRVNA